MLKTKRCSDALLMAGILLVCQLGYAHFRRHLNCVPVSRLSIAIRTSRWFRQSMEMEDVMVHFASIAAMVLTLLLSLVLPVAVYIVYGVRHRRQGVWTAWLWGTLGFFVPQILIRLPLTGWVSAQAGFRAFAEQQFLGYVLLMAATAALFETAGRCGVALILSRRGLSAFRGMAAGLGHGGIESVLLVGITYINNLILAGRINSGTFDNVIRQATALGAPPEVFERLRTTMIETPPAIFALAGLERVLTMVFHAAMSCLMIYCVQHRHTVKGVGLCFLIHTAVDFAGALLPALSGPGMGAVVSMPAAYVLTYVFLAAVAMGSVLLIRRLMYDWPDAFRRQEAA